ncbi:Rpn family recombination-promoting nuclease/putative transposase [Chromobacterium amazonense]|uniref:Rpn family recombination-promoting nuclease/putative transposase n=1 Tax=Chromobacterium amazonense TaxID=1382803 RepID=UPI003F79B0AA
MSTPTPHDAVFKAFLSDIDTARDFLAIHLPPALRDLCDLGTLRQEAASFIEPDLQAYYSDMLYSVQAKGQPGYIYCVIEHQSSPDKLMAFRLMRYSIAAMQHHLKQGHERLPLVVPLLFYHGSVSPYPFSTNWLDLFDLPDTARAVYQQPFPLVDVTAMSDDDILQHRRIALLELVQRHIRQRDMMELADPLVFLFGLGLCSDEQIESLLNYILQVGDTEQPELLLETLAHSSPQYEGVVMTIAQKLEQRAEIRGLERGRQEGEQLGLSRGRQEGIYQVARTMLLNGMDKASIMKLTGLTETDLNQLTH